MRTASGFVQILLTLTRWSSQDLVKDFLFLYRVRIVEQSESQFFELFDRSRNIVGVVFDGDAATLSELVDIFVTVINQKSLFSVPNSVGLLAVRKINFTDSEIKTYFENNKNKYKEIFKFIKLIELTPNKLIASEEFNDTFSGTQKYK